MEDDIKKIVGLFQCGEYELAANLIETQKLESAFIEKYSTLLELFKCSVLELFNKTFFSFKPNTLSVVLHLLKDFTQLTALFISDQDLKEIPQEIYQLKNLETLIISKNKLTEIPQEIYQLQKLTRVDFSQNQISKVCDDFSELPITELNIHENNLVKFPECFIKLTNLVYLDISLNQIDEIPDDIKKLKKLERFRFAHNNYQNLPASLSLLNGVTII